MVQPLTLGLLSLRILTLPLNYIGTCGHGLNCMYAYMVSKKTRYKAFNNSLPISCNFPMNPHVRLFVGGVDWSVCHNLLIGRKVTLPCSYWSTCVQTILSMCILQELPVLQDPQEEFHVWLARHRGQAGGWTQDDHLHFVKLTHR